MIKKWFLIGLLASKGAFSVLAQSDSLQFTADTLLVNDEIIVEPFQVLEDDPVLKQLDSLSILPWFTQGVEMQWADPENALQGRTNFALIDSIVALQLDSLNQLTPLNLSYNDKVQSYINVYVNRKPSVTARVLGLSHLYYPMIEETFDRYDIPLELKHLAVVESALNPSARSKAGAMGLWQFMYGTGKMFGLQVNSLLDERKDPIKATEAAAQYLKYLHNIYNDWDLALAAYNCGPGNVNKAIRRSGGKKNYWEIWPYLPKETRGYVPAFIAVNYVMNHAEQFEIPALEPKFVHFQVDTVHIKSKLNFDQIAQMLEVEMSDIQYLNPIYRTGVIPKTNPSQILYLPQASISKFVTLEDSLYSLSKDKEQDYSALNLKEERTVYKVKSGDNLGKIANMHRVSVNQLKEWNGLRSNTIRVGQNLVIYSSATPSVAQQPKSVQPKTTQDNNYIYHIVQQGDTLWDIAKKYEGVSIEDIKARNKQLNAARLKPGQKIIIAPAT
jgi:membrane-bound lytic murein transglycosylase D